MTGVCFSFSALRWDKRLARSTEEGVAGAARGCTCVAGSRDLATVDSNLSRSRIRWVAAAILPRAAVRPGIPAREEGEGRGREADMVGCVNNI